MITPAPMELLNFVVLKENAEEVAGRLLAVGSFHPVDIRSIESKITGLTPSQVDKENHELETLQAKVKDLLRKFGINPRIAYPQHMQCFPYEETQQLLDSLDKELEPLLQKKEELKEELLTHQSILAQVRQYFPLPIQRGAVYSFLEVSTGRIEEKNIALLERSLTNAPHVLYPFRKDNAKVLALFIGLRRDKALLKKVLDDVAWEEIEFTQESEQLSKEAQKQLAQKIVQARAAIAEADSGIKKMGQLHQEDLSRIFSYINLKRSLLEARRFACTTEKTALFSGWVPREEKEKVISQIRGISQDVYFESKSAEELIIPKEEIPVQFKHGVLLKPFEILIDSYGIPRYGTIDPTIFVALSFLVMFGAMFGDVGHGLVLVVLGLAFIAEKSRRALARLMKVAVSRQAGALLLYCGTSSTVFGILYGSVFGFEFDSLWLKPMADIMGIFRAGIFLGVAIITLGIILNIANAVRDRDYAKAVFDKAGLIGGVVYWAAIGLASKIFLSRGAAPLIYSHLIFGGLLVLFLYPIIENMLTRRHGTFFESLMESMVNILEIFMGYLSNTVSFIRVAAFALAHAGLFLAIFSLSRLTEGQPGTGHLISWVIIIFGNILVVCLEGLIVSIQSLRLNYYEFFSKFFLSGKRMYKPLSV